MIRIVVRTDGHDVILGCTAEGHSDHAPHGQDIVCAGVSTLMITCVNSLDAICGLSTDDTISRFGDGLLDFDLPQSVEPQGMHDAQILLQSLVLGLNDLAVQYPEDIILTQKIRRK